MYEHAGLGENFLSAVGNAGRDFFEAVHQPIVKLVENPASALNVNQQIKMGINMGKSLEKVAVKLNPFDPQLQMISEAGMNSGNPIGRQLGRTSELARENPIATTAIVWGAISAIGKYGASTVAKWAGKEVLTKEGAAVIGGGGAAAAAAQSGAETAASTATTVVDASNYGNTAAQGYEVFDNAGHAVGTVNEYGYAVDSAGNVLGKVDDYGNLVDASGNAVGTVGAGLDTGAITGNMGMPPPQSSSGQPSSPSGSGGGLTPGEVQAIAGATGTVGGALLQHGGGSSSGSAAGGGSGADAGTGFLDGTTLGIPNKVILAGAAAAIVAVLALTGGKKKSGV
jgi:hypothetical protein